MKIFSKPFTRHTYNSVKKAWLERERVGFFKRSHLYTCRVERVGKMPKVPSSLRAILTELWCCKVCGLSFINLRVSASECNGGQQAQSRTRSVFARIMYLFHIFSVSTIAHLIRICSVYARLIAAIFSYAITLENNRISNLVKFSPFIYNSWKISPVISRLHAERDVNFLFFFYRQKHSWVIAFS